MSPIRVNPLVIGSGHAGAMTYQNLDDIPSACHVGYQAHNEQHQKQKEQDFCNRCSTGGNTAETKQCGNEC